MKFKHGMVIGALSVLALLVVFSAGQAYAAAGCFTDTNGHWAEVAICWMKENGITTGIGGGLYGPENNVTRAQMAVFMKAQAEIPPSTGDIYVTQPLSALQPNGNFASTARVSYYDDYVVLGATTSGANYYLLSATVPSSLYGRALVLKGVQICYDATPFRGGTLTLVSFKHFASSGGASVLLREASDSASRTDAACRSYLITSPLSLVASDHISLNLSASIPSSFDFVYISSVSVILSPSTTTGTLSPTSEREPIQDPSLLPDPASSTGANP
jgi:hypothetical protein